MLIKNMAISGIKTVKCDDWHAFKAAIIKHLYPSGQFLRGRFWFRGQTCATHRLESSFDRWYNDLGSKKRRADLAQELLNNFKEEIKLFSEHHGAITDEQRLLALGRHYGLPTRQLDWSESPYVAAFFAFAGCDLKKCGSGEVAIWALDVKSRVWGKEEGVELAVVDRSGNVRLQRQSGGFTILRTPAACLEDHIESMKLKITEAPSLWRFLVPDGLATQALSDLDSMGINFLSLYSGVEGAALLATMRTALNSKAI